MANKNVLSSTSILNTKNTGSSILEKEVNFVRGRTVNWENIPIKTLDPNFKIKSKPVKRTRTSQGLITRNVSTLHTDEVPKVNKEDTSKVNKTTTKSEIQVLTPKTKRKVNNTKSNKTNNTKNNISKIQKYGNERKRYDDFDLYLSDDYEDEDIIQSKQYQPTTKSKNGLKVIFLGGVGEIGKNMTALEYQDEILIIDCGSSFPDEAQLGIDLVVPDISYLMENISKVKAICLTHGHEDHIGALPYILDKVNVPIYGSRLTLGLVENKFREKSSIKLPELICVEDSVQNKRRTKEKDEERKVFQIGKYFKVEFIPVCHSIAGSMALYIQTPHINLVHTGDFKIDFTPVGNETTDLTRFAELGKNGVDLLLCESTNIDRKGFSMSESSVGKTFEQIFIRNTNKRIIVATFASNISRLQQILTLCEKFKRKVVFTGRSMINVTEIASSKEIDALHFNKKIICDVNDIGKYKDEELLILCTGSQGEYRSALTRMAIGEFPKITLGENDTVVISASPIPGNEKSIYTTINNLYKLGCEVIYSELADVHVSGHACQEEIKTIHNLIKPKFFIPVHGEYRHLRHHKDLALAMGMKEENIMICDNGSCVKVTKSGMKMLEPVQSGAMFVDGLGMGDAESSVLRERSVLASEGMCIVAISISRATCNMTLDPEIVTRGLIYKDESSSLILEAKQLLKDKINSQNYKRYDPVKIKNDIKKELQKYFVKAINRKPMIVTILFENLSKN